MRSIATHSSPAWGPKSNFIIRAELEAFGMPGRAEQLWARRLAGFEFEICCIPFFTYGIALGDQVTTDGAYVIQQTSCKGGHRTLRAAIARPDESGSLHKLIHKWAENTELPYEWYAPGYLVVDLPPDRQWSVNVTALVEMSQEGGFDVEIDD